MGETKRTFLFFLFSLLLAGFFGFGESVFAEEPPVIINELMWMGSSMSWRDEWIELKNISSSPLDISEWKLTKEDKNDIIFEIPKNTIIDTYILIAEYNKYSSTLDIEPDLIVGKPDTDTQSFSLSNTDLKIKLLDKSGALIDVAGNGSAPIAGSNTSKKSMERNDDSEDGTKKESWHTCTEPINLDIDVSDCATPRAKNSEELLPPPPPPPEVYSDKILISELFPAPSTKNSIREFVEFYNSSDADINLRGWKLKDDNLQNKTDESCILPDDLIVEKGNYKEFYLASCKSNSISLNNSGDSLTFYNPADPLPIFKVEYKNAKTDLSYSFDGTNWRWTPIPTRGYENEFNNLPTVSSKKTNKIYVNVYADFSAEGNDADNDILKYTWDFGDGHKSYKAKTRHKYEKTGKYTATLKVSDGSEDVITNYDIEVIEFPKLKVKITAISPNPSGSDSGTEYITLKNETKKKVNLKNWSIATGWKNLVNHPIREDFEIKAGKSKNLTNKFASITLNNTKSKIELRDPAGRVINKVKYEKKDGVPDDALYEKVKKKWQWAERPISPVVEETVEVEPEAALPEILENTEDTNTESDMLDEEIQANLGKFSLNPEWQKKRENKILLASAGSNLKITLPESQGQVLGASTIYTTENYYSFTSPTAPEKHWMIKIWENINTLTNSIINKILPHI